MLRAYCLDNKANWHDLVPLMEFVYNNSYQETIKIVMYKALYEKKIWSPFALK